MTATRGEGRARTLIAASAGLVAAALVAVLFVALDHPVHRPAANSPEAALSGYGAAPTYTLTDQHGRPFSSETLRGKVQVVSYLFPYCTTLCPLLARTLVETEQLAERAGLRGKVAFVAFNVDPEGAGPAQLTAFLRQEEIDPYDPDWHYLTGSPARIRHVVSDGFHVFYRKISLAEEEKAEADEKAAGQYTPQPTAPNALATEAHVGYDIVHNDVIEIVDGNGTIRTILSGASGTTPGQILAAVRQALSRQ